MSTNAHCDLWQTLKAAAEAIQQDFLAQQKTLAIAESCTGGLVSTVVTAVAGSSGYFQGGVVTYANAAKIKLLQISPDIIADRGAVSGEVAGQMAVNVCRVLGADVGVSLTGIAGPGGGTAAKPVGTVWCGLAHDGQIYTANQVFAGNRDEVRGHAARWSLELLQALVTGKLWKPGS